MKNVITLKANIKMLHARKGNISLPQICGIALGDGATANGKLLEPVATDNALKHEVLRREYSGCEKISDTCYRYRIELGADEFAGVTFDEAALYDADGDLLAIRVFTGKPKDNDMEMAFEYDDKF